MSIKDQELSIDQESYLRHQNRKIGRFPEPKKATLNILEDRSQESIIICENHWQFSNLGMVPVQLIWGNSLFIMNFAKADLNAIMISEDEFKIRQIRVQYARITLVNIQIVYQLEIRNQDIIENYSYYDISSAINDHYKLGFENNIIGSIKAFVEKDELLIIATYYSSSFDDTVLSNIVQMRQFMFPLLEQSFRILLEGIHETKLIIPFKFPPGIRNVCERYLWYFARILKDSNIQATSALVELDDKTMLTIEHPKKEKIAKEILELLKNYLHLPHYPDVIQEAVKENSDISILQLQQTVNQFIEGVDLSLKTSRQQSSLALRNSQAAKDVAYNANIQNLELKNFILIDKINTLENRQEEGKRITAKLSLLWGTLELDIPLFLKTLKRPFYELADYFDKKLNS